MSSAEISIIPQPSYLTRRTGEFELTSDTVIVASSFVSQEAHLLSQRLATATGYSLPVVDRAAGMKSRIELDLDETEARLGDEGYVLKVEPSRICVKAAGTAGLFYGTQTLLQLLPTAIFSKTRVTDQAWPIPCVLIEDTPRFVWRGIMLDVARHFMPLDFLRRFIDTIALHKINVLQLHLTDDQGWRIEIKKYPKLTEIGAKRPHTLVGRAMIDPSDKKYDESSQEFNGIPHEGFYTQDEIRELVRYAEARHVTIIPEIEMPGHAKAALAAYPEFGCTKDAPDVSAVWGIHDYLFSPMEPAISFLQDILAEVIDLFPSPFIHVGGDEAVKTQWQNNPDCQKRINELGLKDENQMQAYVINRMGDFLSARGRRLVGWDEILEGGLAQNAVVMSWHGETGGITAGQAGHDVVMAPYLSTYFDHYQVSDWTNEPLSFGGTVTLQTAYNYEPVPSELQEHLERHVLGAQGQIWTEYIPTPEQTEYQAFPRVSALAEVVWSDRGRRDYEDFLARLAVHLQRLQYMGVHFRRLDDVSVAVDAKAAQMP